MNLPGKLALGFLQEDNPQKYYFRVQPIFIFEEGGCQKVVDGREMYQEDGYIRIVPDKNELSHFKTRMKSLGRYCAIDLRHHAAENDKIRPNKNHGGENGDRNAYIVYSDVIVPLEPLQLAEVADVGEDDSFARPETLLVVLRKEGNWQGIFRWEEKGENRAVAAGESLLEPDALKEIEPFTIAIDDTQSVELIVDLQRLGVPPVEPAPRLGPRVEFRAPERLERNERFEPYARTERPDLPTRGENLPQEEGEMISPKEEKNEAKDVLPQAAESALPRAAAARVAANALRERSLLQQSGYNPRRGMSIKDIVDDLWRQSRMDQLGHPVVTDVATEPVISPIDQAMNAMREAWSLPEARASLVSQLVKLEGLDAALGAAGAPDAAQERALRTGEEQMRQLEAERLKLMGEIDELKRSRQEKRTELMEELRQTHSKEFDQTEKRNAQLLAAQQEYRQQAEAAKDAADLAGKAFQEFMDGDVDGRLTAHLLSSRAMEMMNAFPRRASAAARPNVEDMSAGEMISQVRACFEGAGFPLTNDEAVNLLALVALGRVMIFSGSCGSGKGEFARTLAAALGIAEEKNGCFVEILAQGGARSLGEEMETVLPTGTPDVRLPLLRRMLQNDERLTPTMLLVHDANRGDVEHYLGELALLGEEGAPRRMRTGAGEMNLSESLRVLMTVRDSGTALSGELLDRAWLVRLQDEPADTPWSGRKATPVQPEKAISLDALLKTFAPAADVPGEVIERVRVLREKLAACGMRLSRRALNDLYAYCQAALPHMTCAPMEVLDFALSQRAMPYLLATADLKALHELNRILPDMPRSLSLLTAALPLPPL